MRDGPRGSAFRLERLKPRQAGTDARRMESTPPPAAESVDPPHEEPIDLGVAGASARAEHAKRRANRQARTRKKYGGLIAGVLELREPPQHEKSWARGALGEERFARGLEKRCNDTVTVLHDRRVPGSRANIDHIAICRSGIWVLDPKFYKGKIAVQKPLFGKKKLVIAGRDRTKLVEGMQRQMEVVREVLLEHDRGVSVQGALCFIDANMPLFGLSDFNGVKLTRPKAIAKSLNRPGPIDREQREVLTRLLAQRLPAK